MCLCVRQLQSNKNPRVPRYQPLISIHWCVGFRSFPEPEGLGMVSGRLYSPNSFSTWKWVFSNRLETIRLRRERKKKSTTHSTMTLTHRLLLYSAFFPSLPSSSCFLSILSLQYSSTSNHLQILKGLLLLSSPLCPHHHCHFPDCGCCNFLLNFGNHLLTGLLASTTLCPQPSPVQALLSD